MISTLWLVLSDKHKLIELIVTYHGLDLIPNAGLHPSSTKYIEVKLFNHFLKPAFAESLALYILRRNNLPPRSKCSGSWPGIRWSGTPTPCCAKGSTFLTHTLGESSNDRQMWNVCGQSEPDDLSQHAQERGFDPLTSRSKDAQCHMTLTRVSH